MMQFHVIKTLLFFFIAASSASASDYQLSPKSSLSTSIGYENSDLIWSIAGNESGQSPNILSELKWDGLNIYTLKGSGEAIFHNLKKRHISPFIQGDLSYGKITKGRNQDSDYLGDNRSYEYSRTNNSADDGDVWQISGAIGLKFQILKNRAILSPLFGYIHYEQNLVICDGYQTIPSYGAFDGLSSSYDTEWKGPWAGLDLEYRVNQNIAIKTSFKHYWLDYQAWADWNLIEEFRHPKSFEHISNGYGNSYAISLEYLFRDNMSMLLSANIFSLKAETGIDSIYYENGDNLVTRLNEVKTKTSSLNLGIVIYF